MPMLDRTDLALLDAVQKNNRLTSEELGQVVNLSPTACQRRLKRLREDGVIEADISVVSPKAVGRSITMIVLVSLERERTITAKDMEDYEAFTRQFFNQDIKGFKTMVVMDRVKEGFAFPMDSG